MKQYRNTLDSYIGVARNSSYGVGLRASGPKIDVKGWGLGVFWGGVFSPAKGSGEPWKLPQ